MLSTALSRLTDANRSMWMWCINHAHHRRCQGNHWSWCCAHAATLRRLCVDIYMLCRFVRIKGGHVGASQARHSCIRQTEADRVLWITRTQDRLPTYVVCILLRHRQCSFIYFQRWKYKNIYTTVFCIYTCGAPRTLDGGRGAQSYL